MVRRVQFVRASLGTSCHRRYAVLSSKKHMAMRHVVRLGVAGVRAEDILIFVVENGFEEWYAGRL